MPKLKSIRFRLTFLFSATLLVAAACALLRDSPTRKLHHGSFEVLHAGELSVYEYFDERISGFDVLPGVWNATGSWITSGSSHWVCYELVVMHDSFSSAEISWDRDGEYCSVSGSMTAVVDPKYVREHSAFPIAVPWSKEPFSENKGSLGEYDEFWDLPFSIITTKYGVILQAGNGDDGAFLFYLGRNSDGDVCAVRCVLESDTSPWVDRFFARPWPSRLFGNLKRLFDR